MKVLQLAAIFLSFLPSQAEGSLPEHPKFAAPGAYPVGVRTLVLVDQAREDPYGEKHRTLVTEVWYPTADDARGGKTKRFVDFFGDHPEAAEAFVGHFGGNLEDVNRRFVTHAVRGAPLRKGSFPLLVFSHGNGGLRHQSVFQVEHLASHGYIVASPDHTGNAGVTVLPSRVVPYDRGGRKLSTLNRPGDLLFVMDSLLRTSGEETAWLRGGVDGESIGLLGHSFGGFTVCQAAALDQRVKAILPMTVVGARPTSVPILVMLAGLDRTVGDLGNLLGRGYLASVTAPKHLVVLRRGGHFSFSDMDKINPDFGDGIGSEKRAGKTVTFLSPDLAKRIINAYTLAFFEHHLRGNPSAGQFLARNNYPDEVEYSSETGAASKRGQADAGPSKE